MWHVLLACCMMHLSLLVHFRAVASLVNSHYHPTICVLPFFFPPHHSRIHAPAATFFFPCHEWVRTLHPSFSPNCWRCFGFLTSFAFVEHCLQGGVGEHHRDDVVRTDCACCERLDTAASQTEEELCNVVNMLFVRKKNDTKINYIEQDWAEIGGVPRSCLYCSFNVWISPVVESAIGGACIRKTFFSLWFVLIHDGVRVGDINASRQYYR